MNKMKIAVLAPIHWRTPPHKQGAWELVASNLTEELVRRGHDVTLYATGDALTKAKLRWVAPSPIFEPQGQQLESKVYGYLHAALVFEDSPRFDIIHNHFDAYPLVFSKLVKTPIITTIHGFSSPQVKEIFKRYNQTSYVSISYSDRRQCPELNWAANIYHGINMDELPFGHEPKDYFAFLGRAHPNKGTHIAIQAAKKASVKLKIGVHIDENDPAVVKYWQEACLPLIDGKQIIHVGEVAAEAKSDFLRGAIATLCPIQWDEPFGLVFVESMASGTPVIAYGYGSAPEVVQDGVGGLVVEPDNFDKFVEAMKQISKLDRRQVRTYAEKNFSIERMVDQYEAAYLKVIDKSKS